MLLPNKKNNEGLVWERPYGWRSIFLERDKVMPKNINLSTIPKTQTTNQPSANKLLLYSNTWNHSIYAKKISHEKSLQPLSYEK